MPTATYTGTLADIGLEPLTRWRPEVWVVPTSAAFGPEGLVSKVPVPVTLDPVTNAFVLHLVPSLDLTPVRGAGRVDYDIVVSRFEESFNGVIRRAAKDVFRFTAAPGGGRVSEMTAPVDAPWWWVLGAGEDFPATAQDSQFGLEPDTGHVYQYLED